jgi:hypothetical protein
MIWKDLSKEERVTLVENAWAINSSAATIAAAITAKLEGTELTRNAIIGIYNRNPGLAISHPLGGGGRTGKASRHHPEFEIPQPVRKPEPKPGKMVELSHSVELLPPEPAFEPVKVTIKDEAMDYDAASRRIPLIDLKNNECRFAVNEPGTPKGKYLFCGHPVARGKVYCQHHHDRTNVPWPARRCR